ncbi:MAG: nucleotidyltransferase domain-containing protein [Pseudomonadota bacterium]
MDLTSTLAILERDLPGLAGVYLFGSRAAAAARPESDVDLAVYSDRPIEANLLREVRARLEAALNEDVDLVDLRTASTVLQMQVLSAGSPVAVINPSVLGQFELRALRDYHDLKRRRAEIEADVVRRGRVYG